MAESKEARLDKAIDDATAAARQSIETYAALAKKGAARLTGDSPADTDTWLELTTRTWAQAARDAAQAWATYNALLRAFADADESEAESPESGRTETEHHESSGTEPDA